jgi:hypothetical protein
MKVGDLVRLVDDVSHISIGLIVEKGWLNDNRNSMIPSYTVHWTRDDGRSFYGRNVPKYSLRLIGDNK